MNQLFEEKMDQLLGAVAKDIGTSEIMITLGMAALFAAILWIAYRFAHTRDSYEPKFAVTLIVLSFVSTILMDLIQTNLALSLGMLGSLSIVRFRTNIKDPRDIGFIIWSMAIGIAAATESLLIGLVGSVILAAVMILIKGSGARTNQMLLVVRGSDVDLNRIQAIVDHMEGTNTIKAKNILSDSFELVYEVNVSDAESNDVIDNIFELGGIDSVNLLAPHLS